MRNLKRVLSLALALVMMLGMMIVTSSAASAKVDFADADEITNKEAVDVMAALGILVGDGTNFNPAQNVTRAEMAKMITYIYLGDVDVSAFKAAATDLTDISGHWAEGYIKFCYNQGIISGYAGLFNPNDSVTAVQAAKMLLVTIGYNADVRGYVGDSWTINTMRDALKSGFFKDVTATGDDVLTRDEAAQMIYNAVQAETVEVTQSLNITTGSISYSYTPSGTDLLAQNFKALSEKAYITGITYDSEKGLYTYTLNTDGTDLGIDNTPEITVDPCPHASLKSATDYSELFGQKVTIVYKNSATENYPIYGIYSDADVVVSGTVGDIVGAITPPTIGGTDTKIKVKGTEYSLTKTAADVGLFTFNDSTSAVGTLDTNSVAKYTEFAAIDNSGDGKIDTIVTYPVTAEKVTYAGSASITAGGNSYTWDKDKGMHTYSGDDYELPTVTKGDYLIVNQYAVGNVARTATVAEVLTGEVTATATGKVQLDGTWYPTDLTLDLGSEYDCQMVNGYVVAAEEVSSDSSDILYVITAEAGDSLSNGKAKVMFADGTTKVIEYKGVNGVRTSTEDLSDDTLYTYEVKDDVYSVKVVSGDNKAGFTGYSSTYDASTGTGHYEYTAATQSDYAKLNGTAIADDAVIFLRTGTSSANYKWTVISGATLKTYTDTDTNAAVTMLTKSTNGQNTVKVAVMMVNGAFGVNNTYAYITSDVYQTKTGNTTYDNYTAWTANGEVTVKDTNTGNAKGDWVVLSTNSDGTYTSSAFVTSPSNGDTDVMAPVAITGFNGTDRTITALALNGTKLADAKLFSAKTQILYVNTTTKQGVEGGEIALSERLATGDYVANAYLVYDCNDGATTLKSISAIIFDVNNDLALANTLGTGTAGYANVAMNASPTTGSATNLTGTLTAALDANTPTNGSAVDTVTIEVKATSAVTVSSTGIKLTCDGVVVTVEADTFANGDVIAKIVVPAKSSGTYQVTIANAP